MDCLFGGLFGGLLFFVTDISSHFGRFPAQCISPRLHHLLVQASPTKAGNPLSNKGSGLFCVH
jgi:hypothetical protein